MLIVVINTVVWPQVQPVLVLLSFVSFAVLVMTVAMGIILGDGTTIPISQVRWRFGRVARKARRQVTCI